MPSDVGWNDMERVGRSPEVVEEVTMERCCGVVSAEENPSCIYHIISGRSWRSTRLRFERKEA